MVEIKCTKKNKHKHMSNLSKFIELFADFEMVIKPRQKKSENKTNK